MPRDPNRPLEDRADRWLFRLANRRNTAGRLLLIAAAAAIVGMTIALVVLG